MTNHQWSLIVLLAAFAYGIRLAGLLAGHWFYQQPRLKRILDDLPGCLLIALVAASLSRAETAAWVAAAISLIAARSGANVVVVMIIGTSVFAVLRLLPG